MLLLTGTVGWIELQTGFERGDGTGGIGEQQIEVAGCQILFRIVGVERGARCGSVAWPLPTALGHVARRLPVTHADDGGHAHDRRKVAQNRSKAAAAFAMICLDSDAIAAPEAWIVQRLQKGADDRRVGLKIAQVSGGVGVVSAPSFGSFKHYSFGRVLRALVEASARDQLLPRCEPYRRSFFPAPNWRCYLVHVAGVGDGVRWALLAGYS